MKRERFFAHVNFANKTVSQTTVSTGPMKMFRLEHETMNVCQRNVVRFGHVECRFDKINDIFSGFWKLGVTAISERWTKPIALEHRQLKLSYFEELLFF